LGTNSGSPIKNQILLAIDAVKKSAVLSREEIDDVVKELEYAMSSEVFKSNASGMAKNYALGVLEKYTNEIYLSESTKNYTGKFGNRNIGDQVYDKFNRKSHDCVGTDLEGYRDGNVGNDNEIRCLELNKFNNRQTSFRCDYFSEFKTLEEIEVVASLRDKYIRKNKKHMKHLYVGSTKKNKKDYDDGDGDDVDEDADEVISDDDSDDDNDNDDVKEDHGNIHEKDNNNAQFTSAGDHDHQMEIDGEQPMIPTIPNLEATPSIPNLDEIPGSQKLFLPTPYDDFAGDVEDAPVTFRKLLAITRTICALPVSERFIYPMSIYDSPTYYEKVMEAKCLLDIGNYVTQKCKEVKAGNNVDEAEVVLKFTEDMQLIVKNTYCYNSCGSVLCNSVDKMSNVFERLIFDWVLSPEYRPLELCDDERCVLQEDTDATYLTTTVLLCDRCDGHYNINTLKPALPAIPKGDWFCPRCCSGMCWFKVDPRLNKIVRKNVDGKSVKVKIISCDVRDSKLSYTVKWKSSTGSIVVDQWSLAEVDTAMEKAGIDVEPVKFADSICKNLGYNAGGKDHGVIVDVIPPNLDPKYSVNAAMMAATNGSFCEALNGIVTLMTKPEDRSGKDWVELFSLLVSQCTNSADIQIAMSEKEAISMAALEQRTKNIVQRCNELNCTEMLRQTYLGAFEDAVEEIVEVADTGQSSAVGGAPVEALTTTTTKTTTSAADDDDDIVMAEVVVEGEGDAALDDGDEIMAVAILDDDDDDDEDKPPPLPTVEAVIESVPEDASQVASQNASVDMDVDAADGAKSPVQSVAPAPRVSPVAVATESSEADLEAAKRGEVLKQRWARLGEWNDAFVTAKSRDELVRELGEEEATKLLDAGGDDWFRSISASLCDLTCEGKVCDICKQSDYLLGTPLLRFPNTAEWLEKYAHAACGRTTATYASLPVPAADPPKKKLVSVSVRIGGELVSDPDAVSNPYLKDIRDGAMLELVPRNPAGFQKEINFRAEASFPFVTGSLSAHHSCAQMIHQHRKERTMATHKSTAVRRVEHELARRSGHLMPVGTDSVGRNYWVLESDMSSLVVQDRKNVWVRYTTAAGIASVLVGLGRAEPFDELRRLFPKAYSMVKDRSWVAVLQGTQEDEEEDEFEENDVKVGGDSMADGEDAKAAEVNQFDDDEEGGGMTNFSKNKAIFVKSAGGKLLWEAKILETATTKGKVVGLRVHYKKWSTRFDEWIPPFLALERTKKNIALAEELEKAAEKESGFAVVSSDPIKADRISASSYLQDPKRARGNAPPRSLSKALQVVDATSSEEITLAKLRAALLTIESALAEGSVDASDRGVWNRDTSAAWAKRVENSKGPSALMQCVLLLESALKPEFMRYNAARLISSLPTHTKAAADASLSSVAIRIYMLDRGLLFAAPAPAASASHRRKVPAALSLVNK
jgi:hypothetical protein